MLDTEIKEIESKKRSLKRYRKNVACVNRLEDKLHLLEERIKSVRSPNYSGMPRGGTPVTIDDLLSDKVDLEKRISRLKKKGDKIKEDIIEEIDNLDDPRHAEVLESYMVDCMSISDIAEEMGYTEVHIYNLYKSAILKLTFSDGL